MITNKKFAELIEAVAIGHGSWAKVFKEDQEQYKQATGWDYLGQRPATFEEGPTFSNGYSQALKDVLELLEYFYDTKAAVADVSWGLEDEEEN